MARQRWQLADKNYIWNWEPITQAKKNTNFFLEFHFFIKYYLDNRTKDDGMGSACGAYEKHDDGNSVRKREGENYLEDIGVVPRIILKRFWKK